MKMRRFFASDMRQAMGQANQQLGPDALILSSRQVMDGVEIIAAADYEDELLEGHAQSHVGQKADVADFSLNEMRQEIQALRNMLETPLSHLAWAELERRQPLRAALLKRLMALGLHSIIANRIADQVWEFEDLEQGWQASLSILESMLPVMDNELLDKGGVVALLGPTGVGKTTTVAKLAARFALCHGRRHVVLVTMDCYRVGAHDQLRSYGRLLGIPVHVAADKEELQAVLAQMQDRKLILIDTAGTGQRDMRLSRQLAALDVGADVIKRYLVLSATGQMALHDEIVRTFKHFDPVSCILTKVDEAISLGGVFSVLVRHKLPLGYIGNGQRVPEDLHRARAQSLISHAAKLIGNTETALSDTTWVQDLGAAKASPAAHVHA